MACASTVEVVVPSPAISLVLDAASLSNCAPIFSNGSSSSISLATETPSCVIVGEPNLRSTATLRPLGPRVALTAFATVFIPFLSLRRASSEKTSCLAAIFYTPELTFNHGQNVAFAQDKHFLAIHLYLGAGILCIQHLIPNLYFHGDAFTLFITFAGSRRQDLAFLRFLFSGFGKDNPSSSNFILLDRFNDHASAKGL